MPKYIKIKGIVLIILEIVALIAVYFVLNLFQTKLSYSVYEKDLTAKLDSTETALADSWDVLVSANESYDSVNQSKARIAAYYAKNDDSIRFGERSMERLRSILDVQNVIVLTNSGVLITSALPTGIDFTAENFDVLRETFDTHEATACISVETGSDNPDEGAALYYYGMYVDDNAEIVIEQSSKELDEITRTSTSWKSILSRNTYGLNGICFAVKDADTFIYFPDEEIMNESPSKIGINSSKLKSRYSFTLDISDISYMCKSRYIENEESYVICGVDTNNVLHSIRVCVLVIMFIIFACILLQILYAVMIMWEEDEARDSSARIHSILTKKMWGLFAVCIMVIIISSFFIQSLYTISIQLFTSGQELDNLAELIDTNRDGLKSTEEDYNSHFITKALIASDFINNNPEKADKNALIEMAQALDVEHILIYDKTGCVTVSDSTYKGLTLSEEPEDPSYAFRKLLYGIPSYIASEVDDTYLNTPYLFCGSILIDKEGNPDGFVQLAINPEAMQKALNTGDISNVLGTFNGTNDSYAFAIDKTTGKFVYHPNSTYIGKEAMEYGLNEKQLRDGYSGYITLNGEKLFSECIETGDMLLYVAVPYEKLEAQSFPRILSTAATAAAAFFLFCIVIILYCGKVVTTESSSDNTDSGSESGFFFDRLHAYVKNTTAEERIKTYLGLVAIVVCGSVFLADALKNRLFADGSVMRYVMDEKWDKGFNIFAVISCFISICKICFITAIVTYILKIMKNTLDQRGETVCKMLISFADYIAVLGAIFSCLGKLGVETGTLLASAGILTAVIGFGAQKLIADVLEGLFIVFEGVFKVGDMVMVGDYRGIIQEIGIRTTKIFDLDHNNIKIFNNTNLGNVENLSQKVSFCDVVIGSEYSDDLRKLEEIFAKELPEIKKNIPTLLEGPKYVGVDSFGDSSVNLRFRLYCKEEHMTPTRRAFNREIKLMFDRNGINVPFPQVVLSNREE
ncbi:MAG: mechanosensitive ion channel [Lachnospiraceae bacterium]|nr:mechanosensitive ion channel [Lachnospiraceae bacterium]